MEELGRLRSAEQIDLRAAKEIAELVAGVCEVDEIFFEGLSAGQIWMQFKELVDRQRKVAKKLAVRKAQEQHAKNV